MEQAEPTRKKKFSILKMIRAIVVVALVVGIAGLGYLYYQTRQELQFLSSPSGQDELAKREVEKVVSSLGKLAILPEEEPVVATITDYEALASQSAFYTNAVNGDKLVVYPKAQQAFIFSPSRNKIVNVGPLLIEDAPVGENAQGTTETVSGQTIQVEIRNGSGVAGKATTFSQQLTSQVSGVQVASVGDAANNNYKGLVVVDNSNGTLTSEAQQLAQTFNGTVVNELPAGEASSNADLVLIVGNE